MSSKQNLKIVGIILIVIGVALLVWGFQLSDSFSNQVTESFTGSSSDPVMFRYIAGAASLAVGVFLFLKK